jgi:hypothetical protein
LFLVPVGVNHRSEWPKKNQKSGITLIPKIYRKTPTLFKQKQNHMPHAYPS